LILKPRVSMTDFVGQYEPIDEQISKSHLMKTFDNPSNLEVLTELKVFIIQKKDETKIGDINHRLNQSGQIMEIVITLLSVRALRSFNEKIFGCVRHVLFSARAGKR